MMGCLESLSRINEKCEISRLSPQSVSVSLNDTIPYRTKVVQEVLASCGCPLHCYPPSWEKGLLFQGLVELNLNYDTSASVLILNKNKKSRITMISSSPLFVAANMNLHANMAPPVVL